LTVWYCFPDFGESANCSKTIAKSLISSVLLEFLHPILNWENIKMGMPK